jgi:hypothetical protein
MASDDDKFPPSPETTQPVGWYPVNDGSDQETYWDGTAWTKRRQYRFGSPFLEIPLHKSDRPLDAVAPSQPPPVNSTSFTPVAPQVLDLAPPRTSVAHVRTRHRHVAGGLFRFVLMIGLVVVFIMFFTQSHTTFDAPKYFLVVFSVGILSIVVPRLFTLSARRNARYQGGANQPQWPFRHLSSVTDGLQGGPVRTFVGGIRLPHNYNFMRYNATWPCVRLSLFANGFRMGPSASGLRLSVPTWEARFDELDVVQAAGSAGILFRKRESQEWAIFWTFDREAVFTSLEGLGVTVSRDVVRVRLSGQFGGEQFVASQVHASASSLVGSAPATVGASAPATPHLVYADPLTPGALTATYPSARAQPKETRTLAWAIYAVIALFILGVFFLVLGGQFSVTSSPAALGTSQATTQPVPGTSEVAETTTLPVTVTAISPAKWRTFAKEDIRQFASPLAALPNLIMHLRTDDEQTETSHDVVDISGVLGDYKFACVDIYGLGTSFTPPTPTLGAAARSVGASCRDLVTTVGSDMKNSNNVGTTRLASDDMHWQKILKERLTVLTSEMSR